jgi:hypothetical protein
VRVRHSGRSRTLHHRRARSSWSSAATGQLAFAEGAQHQRLGQGLGGVGQHVLVADLRQHPSGQRAAAFGPVEPAGGAVDGAGRADSEGGS